jgi:hypothetical protein
MIYVLIDGTYHVQVEDSASRAASTACGIPVPFGAEWTRHLPDKVCGKCVPPKKKAA